jgi:hypothetical protein
MRSRTIKSIKPNNRAKDNNRLNNKKSKKIHETISEKRRVSE